MLILWDLSADATFHVARKGCPGPSGRWHVSASGISLIVLSMVLIGCASHSLVPAAQSAAITQRERALASHAAAIQTAVRQSGSLGALAFLDAGDGRLVVLPGDSPADAWARYVASPERETRPAAVPPVVTFVYRADVPKAPETVTWVALQQERTSAAALATDLRRLEERLSVVQGELAATKVDTDKAVAEVRAIAEDLAGVRKFMLQTAQLGWLSHELTLENANGVRRMAATSQELVASSARLEETLRQLSENLSGQLKELAARLDGIQGKIQNIK